jgi:hypothetical protein
MISPGLRIRSRHSPARKPCPTHRCHRSSTRDGPHEDGRSKLRPLFTPPILRTSVLSGDEYLLQHHISQTYKGVSIRHEFPSF